MVAMPIRLYWLYSPGMFISHFGRKSTQLAKVCFTWMKVPSPAGTDTMNSGGSVMFIITWVTV